MDPLVHHQVGLPAKALPTFYTLKCFFSRMGLQVVQKPGAPLKALPTFCTLVGFLFCLWFLAISNEGKFPEASFLVRGFITGCPPVWAVGIR